MQQESESTRRRILSVTAELLASSATGEVSNREVCEAAGITPPTLYHHFGDKDGLMQAVVFDAFDHYLIEKNKIGLTGDSMADFRRGWDMHVEFGVENPTLYELMYGRPASLTTTSAAAKAHNALREFVAAIESQGRLLLSVDATTDVLESAATGVTLHLIRSDPAPSTPVSEIVRDSLAKTLISPTPRLAEHDVTPALAAAAGHLRDELPHGAVGPLRAVETALLHTWLETLHSDTP